MDHHRESECDFIATFSQVCYFIMNICRIKVYVSSKTAEKMTKTKTGIILWAV